MHLRPYQCRAVDFLLPRHRAFIEAPAGSGKTIIAAMAAATRSRPFDRVVWLANTQEQCQQARKAIGATSGVVYDVHCVAAKPDIAGADLVIIDESHHLPAVTWWTTVMDAQCAVWGFSATPFSGDWQRDGVLRAFFGAENFLKIPRDEVLAGGSIVKGVVHIHDIDQPGEFDQTIAEKTEEEVVRRRKRWPNIPKDEHERRARWQFTAEAVRTNSIRNSQIANIARGEDAALVLVSSIEHGELLRETIPGSAMVCAKMGKKKRAAAIEAFRNGALKCMIATSLADEGLDVPRASVLVLASGGRSAGKLEQRAGRVMRPHAGKDFGTVHDFADRGAALAHNQFKARARTYKRLGYKIQ